MAEKPKSLDPKTLDRLIVELRRAKALAAEGKTEEAVAIVRKEWEAFPEPKMGWDWSEQFLEFNAKLFRDMGRYEEAHRWADQLLAHATFLSGPEIIKGSIFLAAGDVEGARSLFQKAYDRDGRRAFQGENPKYLALLKGKAATKPKF